MDATERIRHQMRDVETVLLNTAGVAEGAVSSSRVMSSSIQGMCHQAVRDCVIKQSGVVSSTSQGLL